MAAAIGGSASTAGTGSAPVAGRGAGPTAGSNVAATAGSAATAGAAAVSGAGGSAGGDAASSAGDSSTAGGAGSSGDGAYNPCPAAGTPCKILPLGDSITYGVGYDGGYRIELFNKAVQDGKQITFVGSLSNGPNMVAGKAFPRNNEGHSGWKINQLLPLIPDPAFKDDPDIVLLMIGTNDITQNDNLAMAPMRLSALIDKIIEADPRALLVVAKITPPRSGPEATEKYNDSIPELVQQRATAGKHITLVDMFTGFPSSELGDFVHPNQQGYERMAGIWYRAIGPLLR